MLLFSLGSAISSCSGERRPAAAHPGGVELSGRVLHIQDASETDGPIVIMIAVESGETIDLHFGSMFTSPSPDRKRRATFEVVRRTRVGDRVRAYGSLMDGGPIWLDFLENLDRD